MHYFSASLPFTENAVTINVWHAWEYHIGPTFGHWRALNQIWVCHMLLFLRYRQCLGYPLGKFVHLPYAAQMKSETWKCSPSWPKVWLLSSSMAEFRASSLRNCDRPLQGSFQRDRTLELLEWMTGDEFTQYYPQKLSLFVDLIWLRASHLNVTTLNELRHCNVSSPLLELCLMCGRNASALFKNNVSTTITAT